MKIKTVRLSPSKVKRMDAYVKLKCTCKAHNVIKMLWVQQNAAESTFTAFRLYAPYSITFTKTYNRISSHTKK